MALTAETLKSQFGFNDQNVINNILSNPTEVARYEKEMGGGGSPQGSGATASLTPVNVDDYLKEYQNLLFGSFGDGSPQTRTSYSADELTRALVERGGYNETDARNAANNAGGRADELAREFLGVGGTGSGGGTTGTLFSSIKSMLEPATPYPEPLNRVQQFQDLRAQYGLTELEGLLTDLKAQQEQEFAQLRINKAGEFEKPVATNVIAGRVGEHERAAAERIDAVQRQIGYITDQVNSAYAVINTVMNLQNLDYQDAVAKYNTEFSQNLQALELTRGIASDMVDIKFKQQDQARANLQIMANAITSGNLNPNSISADQRTQLAKLETQSGLPVGFVSSLQLSEKDRIITTSTSNGITSVVYSDGNGGLSVKRIQTGTSTGGGTQSVNEKALKEDILKGMTSADLFKKWGNAIAPNTIAQNYNKLSPHGEFKESPEELKQLYNITDPGGTKAESTVSEATVNTAKQLILRNGGTDDDLKRAETDANFVNWIIATYGG